MNPFQGRVPERQYVKNKPNPVGVKLFVRCGRSGLSEDHRGLGLGGSIVMCLVENLPERENFKVYFDNFFSTFQRLTEYEKPTQLHSYSTEENTSICFTNCWGSTRWFWSLARSDATEIRSNMSTWALWKKWADTVSEVQCVPVSDKWSKLLSYFPRK